MFNKRMLFAGLCVVLGGCVSSQMALAEDQEAPGWLAKDFAEFTALFPGQWDNDRHVFFAEDAGMDVSEIAPRQHIQIEPVQSDEDPSPNTKLFKAVRTVQGEAPIELVHTLTLDLEQQTIRQTITVPGADPLDCAFDWQRDGAQFRGMATGDECALMFPRPEEGGPLEVSMVQSETEFWVTASRGENVIEARMRRARPFECWTAILRGASHGDSGEGMRDWDFRRGVTLHDQGGEAELITDEETPRRVRLRLRNVDWPYGTNRPSLTLYILEGDSERAVSYAWNEGNAERIGINLRWLQASCTYAPADES